MMRMAIIAALCVIWMAAAYHEYRAGDMMLAGVFVMVGIALTAYRVSKLRG